MSLSATALRVKYAANGANGLLLAAISCLRRLWDYHKCGSGIN